MKKLRREALELDVPDFMTLNIERLTDAIQARNLAIVTEEEADQEEAAAEQKIKDDALKLEELRKKAIELGIPGASQKGIPKLEEDIKKAETALKNSDK